MKNYLVVYEQTKGNWAAFSPDVPGCVATGYTRQEAEKAFTEALAFHLEGLAKEGLPIPEPRSEAGMVAVSVPE